MTQQFDPLEIENPEFVATAIKQRVRNIIRSYNHPADILAEPIQNAVDEVEEAVRTKAIERGQVVTIDCNHGTVKIADNGRGISIDDIKRLLAPDMTDKAELFRVGRSRGHKGVGLTFLTYGFNYFHIESRTSKEHYSVKMRNSRRWIEDVAIATVPQATLKPLSDRQGSLRHSGTIVTIQVDNETEPKDLFRTFSSIEYSRSVIEAQTAIGVFPTSQDPSAVFDAQLTYLSKNGTSTSATLSTTYRFPHRDIKKGIRTFDVGSYLANSPPTTPPLSLRSKHQAVFRFYSTEELIRLLEGRTVEGDAIASSAELFALLTKHNVTAYGLAGYGAEYKTIISESWHVPVNRKLIAPSIRVATDGMISSWQRDLSLSHRGFNVERIWIVTHLQHVEPDLGRKDYPPEILELLRLIEDPIANDIAKQGEPFLLPASRSGKAIDTDDPREKAAKRRTEDFPYELPSHLPTLRYATAPTEEQDVLALFNELRGLGLLTMYVPVFFSGDYAYDSYLEYHSELLADDLRYLLGVNDAGLTKRQREGVAEFKFLGNDIIDDIVKGIKEWADIRWLVCWIVKTGSLKKSGQVLDVVEADVHAVEYSGVTHIATLESGGDKVVHVIALSDFLKRLQASKPSATE